MSDLISRKALGEIEEGIERRRAEQERPGKGYSVGLAVDGSQMSERASRKWSGGPVCPVLIVPLLASA